MTSTGRAQSGHFKSRKRVGENVRLARSLLGLSQKTLAEKAGVDRGYLGRIERGERGIRLDYLDRLATALGLDVADLVGDPDPKVMIGRLFPGVREAGPRYITAKIRNLPSASSAPRPVRGRAPGGRR